MNFQNQISKCLKKQLKVYVNELLKSKYYHLKIIKKYIEMNYYVANINIFQ